MIAVIGYLTRFAEVLLRAPMDVDEEGGSCDVGSEFNKNG